MSEINKIRTACRSLIQVPLYGNGKGNGNPGLEFCRCRTFTMCTSPVEKKKKEKELFLLLAMVYIVLPQSFILCLRVISLLKEALTAVMNGITWEEGISRCLNRSSFSL